jgi:hypothetical protein
MLFQMGQKGVAPFSTLYSFRSLVPSLLRVDGTFEEALYGPKVRGWDSSPRKDWMR